MIALYSRVSTQEQAVEGYSIGEQEERLRSYAASFGWRDVKLYTDAGFSGASLDRPAMQELIRDVERGLVSRVVVYKLDRLSRSQKDTLYLIEDVFLASGCEFVSMSESFSTETPVGRATIGLLAVFAQLERETIKERMTIGRTARAKAGLYHGGVFIPTGYDYTDGHLVVNEDEAEQVRELFRLYLAGKSVRALTETFNSRGYLVDGKPWTRSRVRTVLENPVYIGKITFDGVVYDGEHEPILDVQTFEAAQRLLADRAARYENNRVGMVKSDLLLVGLCYCKKCGARMITQTGTRHGSSERYRYYVCKNFREKFISRPGGCLCDARAVRSEKLEEAVLSQIRLLQLDPAFVSREKKKKRDERPALRRQIDKADRQISRLLDLYASGNFDADQLTEKVEALRQTRQKAQNRLFEIESGKSSDSSENVQKRLSGFSDAVDRADSDQLKVIIRSLIDRIEYADDEVVIRWRFE